MTDAQTLIVPRRAPVQHRPGPPAKRRAAPRTGPSPKVKAAIERMIFGSTHEAPVTRQEAAKAVGISDETLRAALRNPVTMKYWNEQLDVLRTSARPRALHSIAHLSHSADAEGVKLKAAIYLDGGDKGSGVTVNVGLGVNVAPGYMIDVSEHAAASPQLLKQARSIRNALENSQSVPTDDEGTP